MDQAPESSKNRGHPILVTILSRSTDLPPTNKLAVILEGYFQAKKSGGGECEVHGTEDGMIYRVVFKKKEDKENVLQRTEHTVDSRGSELKLSVHEDRRQVISHSNRQTSKENMVAETNIEKGMEPPSSSQTAASSLEREVSPTQWDSSQEIFPQVTAFINPTFCGLLKEKKFPSVRVRKLSKGELEITGSFSAIQEVHDYMKRQLMDHKETNSYNAENQPPPQGEATVRTSPPLYQYFSVIYLDVVDKIKDQYKVKMRTDCTSQENTDIHFFSIGPDSSVEKAKQCFIDTIQRITADWSQITVELKEKNLSVSDIERRVRKHCSKTQTILEGNTVTLRGPERELSEAKRLLEEGSSNPPTPQKFMHISSLNMIRDLSVDVSHWELLKKLKSNQIQEIEGKYNVIITEKRNNGDKHIQISFTTRNGPPDLSPHACQIFLSLLQKTLSNIKKREIKIKTEFQETKLSSFQEHLMKHNIEIITNWHNGALVLIGSLGNIHTAEKILHKWLNCGATGADGGEDEAMDTSDSTSTEIRKKPEEEKDKCPVCLCEPDPKLVLEKCKHVICAGCWEQAKKHKPVCPVCNVSYGAVIGNQPEGKMSHSTSSIKLAGHTCGTITINYFFPSGVQGKNHPNPGQTYFGTSRTAYLPDNQEGNEILRLLYKAFQQKLVFTIGQSRTTGADNSVTWNDIHHKTNTGGGPQQFGYPDPNYLNRVRDELKAKGVE